MIDVAATVEIPNRALFKAAEVCELVHVQPYVLRSWEAEFPELGVAKSAGAPRIYRRADVEQVLRIKHLLLVEGLTLAGARRRIEEEDAPPLELPQIDELVSKHARERIGEVKRGLKALLDLLSSKTAAPEFVLTAAPMTVETAGLSAPRSRAADAPAKKAAKPKAPAPAPATARKKR